jgi:hypothetical protein
MKIEVLDKRHAGHSVFTHRVKIEAEDSSVYAARERRFIEIRNWCWENFGPGCERDLAHYSSAGGTPAYNWGWHIDAANSSKLYIYLKGEAMTLFSLKWCNT